MINYSHPNRFSYSSKYISIINAVYRALLMTENSSYFNHPSSSKRFMVPTKKEDARIVKLRELYKGEFFKNETPKNQHKLMLEVISEEVSNTNNFVNSFIRDIKDKRAIHLDSLMRFEFSPDYSKTQLIIHKDKHEHAKIKKTNFRINHKAHALAAANFIVNQLQGICEKLKIKNLNESHFTAILAEEIFNHYQSVKYDVTTSKSVADFLKNHVEIFLKNLTIADGKGGVIYLDDKHLQFIYESIANEIVIENNHITVKSILEPDTQCISSKHQKADLPYKQMVKYRDSLSTLVAGVCTGSFELLPKELLLIILLLAKPDYIDDTDEALKIIKWNEQRLDSMSDFFKCDPRKNFVKLRTDLDLTTVLKK